MPQRPTVSFCTLSDVAPSNLRPLLSILRPYVDEIVVVCDEKIGEKLTLEYAAIPEIDKLRVAAVTRPIETFLEAMMRECEGDWILRLDSDEIPSSALLELLGDLSAIHNVYTHAWLKCVWLWPDSGHRLSGAPWGFDRQLRLFRNVPQLWQLSPQIHSSPRVLGPGVMLNHHFFHSTLLQLSFEERNQKAAVYERLGPGIRTRQGASTNFSYYLPELTRSKLDIRPLSEVDRGNVDVVMAHSLLVYGNPRLKAEVLISTRDGTEVAQIDDYSESLKLEISPEFNVKAGYPFVIDCRLVNTSESTLSLRGSPPLQLGAVWIESTDRKVLIEERAGLPEVIPPEFEISAPIELCGPRLPGTYFLRIDLVTEGVRWHEVGATLEVLVQASDRSKFDEVWDSWAGEMYPFTPDEAYFLFASSQLLTATDSIVVNSESFKFRESVLRLLELGHENLSSREYSSDFKPTPKNFGGESRGEVHERVSLCVHDWSAKSADREEHSYEPTKHEVIYRFSNEPQDAVMAGPLDALGSVGRLCVFGNPAIFGERLQDVGPNWDPPKKGISSL